MTEEEVRRIVLDVLAERDRALMEALAADGDNIAQSILESEMK